jgi:hypothetical protein
MSKNEFIKKILKFSDNYIDLQKVRNIIFVKNFLFYYIKYITFFLFLTKKKKIKSKIILNSFPYSMAGVPALENCYDMINYINKKKIIGDICEFGVAKGGSSLVMALTEIYINKFSKRIFFLFDSFEGLPAPDLKKDFDSEGSIGSVLTPIKQGSLYSNLEEVKKLFYEKFNLPKNKIIFIKGFFNITVKKYKKKINKISILRLDGDWYHSVFLPLKFYYPKVSKGGVIIIDDYNTCVGAKNALDDYQKNIKKNFKLHKYSKGGVYFFKF